LLVNRGQLELALQKVDGVTAAAIDVMALMALDANFDATAFVHSVVTVVVLSENDLFLLLSLAAAEVEE